MFLSEGDSSEESFFEGMEKMAYPDRIKNHGKKVSLKLMLLKNTVSHCCRSCDLT